MARNSRNSCRRTFLVIRSSREWNVRTASRPSGASRSKAAGNVRSTTPSSSFTAMAQRLERPLGRVPPGAAGGGRNVGAHQVHQPRRVPEGFALTFAHDGRRDPRRELLLAPRPQQPRQLAVRVGVEDVGGRGTGRRVHAHVQRGVPRVGETPVVLVELQGGDAEVEEHRVDGLEAEVVEGVGEAVGDRVHQAHAVAELVEAVTGELERLGVAVHADEPQTGVPAQQLGGVPPHAQREVDADRAGVLQGGREDGGAALEQDGGVPLGGLLGAGAGLPPSSRPCGVAAEGCCPPTVPPPALLSACPAASVTRCACHHLSAGPSVDRGPHPLVPVGPGTGEVASGPSGPGGWRPRPTAPRVSTSTRG